ncbi:MAG: hypothetical protein WC415_01950 [Patescibacteria group bacterium]|jgi:hypothetical protein
MEKKTKKTLISKRNIINFLAIVGFIIASFNFGQVAKAASLYFSPTSGSYAVDKNFSVSIYISSADQAMNTASSIILFPKDKLKIISISKTGSIFNFWVKEPAFDNEAGTITFEGIVLNPGFMDKNGKIITLTFGVKTVGTASLNFSSGLVLANDGNGTNIPSSWGKANYSLTAATPAPPVIEPVPTPVTGNPLSPSIFSLTHPNVLPWYNNNNPQFTWTISSDITSSRALTDRLPNSRPTTTYSPPFAEEKVNNLEDGVWYLHVQLKNKDGWGDITHFRFQIDTKSPEQFTVTFVDGKETDNPYPKILLRAVDASSGIDFYQIKIDDGEIITIPAEAGESTTYTLPLQKLGEHSLTAQAFDRAGNYATATAEKFTIESILPPVFTDYSSAILNNEILIAKGMTYPNNSLIIWLQKRSENPQSFQIESDKNGVFVFTYSKKLKNGAYQLWAETVDPHGAKSDPSKKLTITAKQPLIWKIGPWTIDFPNIMVLFLVLIIFLAVLLRYLRKQKSYQLLKEDVRQQIKFLEKTRTKRSLTSEEKKAIIHLRKSLSEKNNRL